MKVEKTTDYKKFKKIKGNRDIAPRHLKNLVTSIAEKNLLEYNPIKVNAHMEVIDGQHRLAAAQRLGVPIYYLIDPYADLNDVIRFNSNQKDWSLINFLASQIEEGNKNYRVLADFVAKYELPVGISIHILSGEKASAGHESKNIKKSSAIRDFKDGVFEPTNLKKAEFIGERLLEIKPHTDIGVWKDRAFIDALMVVYTKVKPSMLIEALERSGLKVSKKAVKRDYLLFFEDIYNFRKSSGRQKFY